MDQGNEKYIRTQRNVGYLIILNWTTGEYSWKIPEDILLELSVLMISNYDVKEHFLPGEVALRPFEAVLYLLS